MYIQRHDPSQFDLGKDRKSFRLALKLALASALVLWSVTLIAQLFDLNLVYLGVYPRSISGLLGVLFAPLIHSGWSHLFSNTLPLIVGLLTALYTYPNASMRALPIIYFGSSALAWTFARPSYHIGASGFIFGILAFVFVSGILRRDMRAMAVSMIIWFMYASMIWGVLPIREGTSWEMHLAGAIIGVLVAIKYRLFDTLAVKKYSWEDEESEQLSDDWQDDAERIETKGDD